MKPSLTSATRSIRGAGVDGATRKIGGDVRVAAGQRPVLGLFEREIGHDGSRDAEVSQAPRASFQPVVQEDVVVSHRNQRDVNIQGLELAADRLEGGPGAQRAQTGLLDDHAVHHGVRKGDANLNRVRTARRGRFDVASPIGRRPGHEVRHESRASRVAKRAQGALEGLHDSPRSRARTWATSLSPRPERLSKMVAPVGTREPISRVIQANACAVSRAGMIPSLSLSSDSASRTSSSPTP